ncbi:hypothetical protein Tco_1554979 [Tanacetum coccineum]
MSSVTTQQIKLDMELVPKEKRLEIRKCNGRLNPGKKQREPTFQVVLDALALTPCYSAFLITADVPEVYMHQFWDSIHKVHGQNFDELPTNEDIVSFFKELGHTREIKTITDIVVDQMHQPWRTFTTIINRSLSGKITGLNKLRLSRAQILWGKYYKKNVNYVKLLWEDFTYQIDNRCRDDYLINTLRYMSLLKEESQIYGAQLPKSMTSLGMRESKAYKTYLGYATGATPPKKARKFKKHASPKLTTVPVSPEEPTRKSKRKGKITVEKRKGINLSSKVALTVEAQYQEVRKKSLRDFHKTHPSGSGTVTKLVPSAAKIKPSVTNEGTGAKPGVSDLTEEESTKSEAESWGRDEDENNNDRDSRSEGSNQECDSGDDNTQSDSEKWSDFEHETDENETRSESNQEENKEDVEDDVEEKNGELVKTLSNSIDDEDETNVDDKTEGDEDEGMDYTTNQFDDDVNIRLNEPKTEVPVTSSSHSSDLASKFLNFSDIPHTDAEIVSPMDVHVHHKVPSDQTPTLLTVPVSVITESSPIFTTVIVQSLPSFTPPPQQSTPTPPPTTEATNPLSTLPNFASVFQFNIRVTTLEKEVVKFKKNDPLNI